MTPSMTLARPELDETCINTLRFLVVDMVQKANSGHPGLPLGSAAMAYALWDRSLKFNPRDPFWPDRDRFVLSAGHGCALLYALLHVTGFDLPLEELKRFRQWGSRTPGHPEYGKTPGVEANGAGNFEPENWSGRNMHFGIREHAMGAILNGMALHGGLIPYGGTFLIFSDYMRPPMRLAAMTALPVIYVFTHDSIAMIHQGDGVARRTMRLRPRLRQSEYAESWGLSVPGQRDRSWELQPKSGLLPLTGNIGF